MNCCGDLLTCGKHSIWFESDNKRPCTVRYDSFRHVHLKRSDLNRVLRASAFGFEDAVRAVAEQRPMRRRYVDVLEV